MWLLPSWNRVGALAACLATMKTVGVSTPGKIILGPDQKGDIQLVKKWTKWPVECQSRDDHSLIDVMNRFVWEHPDLPWYGFVQDDLLFKTAHWDTRLVAAAGRLKIASCNDCWRAPHRNTGAAVFGGELVRAWGFWGPPKLQHCYIDDFWEESGRECKNWTVLMDVKTPHLHFANRKAKRDATYNFSYKPMHEDQAEWYRFRASNEYTELLNRVKSLLVEAA